MGAPSDHPGGSKNQGGADCSKAYIVGEEQVQALNLSTEENSRSKARCTGFDGLSGWLDRDAGGNQAISVDDRKHFSIFTALQIERLDRVVVGAIDMNHLARI
jgi:hypothetical protein